MLLMLDIVNHGPMLVLGQLETNLWDEALVHGGQGTQQQLGLGAISALRPGLTPLHVR